MGRGGQPKAREDGAERKCIATGEVLPKGRMIRFVVGPGEMIVPDIMGKLPGRGIWVSATREALEKAVAKKLFARAARQAVELPEDLVGQVEALLARHDTSPIVIKAHPRDDSDETRDLIATAAADPRVRVTHGNIHDILAAARVTVTINSAVGLESLMHRVPVVLCGPADFHHSAVTVRDPFDLDAGLAKARLWPWHYAPYLYWFLKLNCVNAGAPDMIDDVLARIAATGYDASRLLPGGVRV